MMLECRMLIPFGSPVEPEVNRRHATLESFITGCFSIGSLARIILCQPGISILSLKSPSPAQRIEVGSPILGNSFSITPALARSAINIEQFARSRILSCLLSGYLG